MIETTVDHNELLAMIIFLIGYIPICIAFVRNRQTRLLFAGYSLLLLRSILSVVEVFYMQTLVNYIEHIVGVMLASFVFFVCAYLSHKRLKCVINKVSKQIRQKNMKAKRR